MSIFTKVSMRRPQANKFNLSHERKMSLDMGYLVPMYIQDVLPGDVFRAKSEIFMRLAPLLSPVMHRVNVYTHYFFVPNRLIWSEWEDFITGGADGTLAPVAPYIRLDTTTASNGKMAKGSLSDYFGLPIVEGIVQEAAQQNISALPFRAYQLIYNEYYRDQNLTSEIIISKNSGQVTGVDITRHMAIRKRAWEKDYFTSALPWAQRGGDVDIPVDFNYKQQSDVVDASNDQPVSIDALLQTEATGGGGLRYGPSLGTSAIARIENLEEDAIGVTINALRRSLRLQEWLEKNARGGSRYIEQILSHFGVMSSDARLQRPEYLGGGKQPVVMSEVLATAEGTNVPVGDLRGHGMSAGSSNGFKRRFEEHGWVIGIMSVLPRTAYQEGIWRKFSYEDKFDYYWPEFAHLGEQEIKAKELAYVQGQYQENDEVWGYTPRYAEYKFMNDSVHGDFRDNLAFWHMGRIFNPSSQVDPQNAGTPSLSTQFIEADPTKRIFAVESANVHSLYCQIYNRIDALRLMPYFGTPTL